MRKNKLVNRIWVVTIILSLLVSLCPFSDAGVQAKSVKDNQKDWGQKYIDFILNHQVDNSINEAPYIYDGTTYDLIYIDDDDIPEIICCPKEDFTGVLLLYMRGDEVEYYQLPRKASLRYIEQEGIFEITGFDWTISNYWGRDNFYTQIYVLNNGYIGERASGSFSPQIDEDGSYYEIYEYEWEEEIVSETQYNKELEKAFDSKKASKYYSECETLTYNCTGILLEIMKICMVYSDIPWIRAYQDFLVNKKYLDMGQDYGSETEIIGKLFDMDHDGVPELILDN
ncbi:MAG: hypothetical protein IK007_08020 [Lachnospiraceae bacterium]|nr:hypothetical protein [Lachnospiraceae bacterium]